MQSYYKDNMSVTAYRRHPYPTNHQNGKPYNKGELRNTVQENVMMIRHRFRSLAFYQIPIRIVSV